ncbi:hypothetical protein GM3708_2026 [Geminocystis sp. NIES-3708]|uniref:hypothetical protein n=1 Tax=Geminocystis sp. NIES-3708 TaxID=1615909 RepID=UPI0005FC4DB0|nr:hypothetical protein [Geminocystis sp. NIES-3708]BAQ61620.1 hypothetical protein GM3708_2026 [Geminocystis sp. NIES-3708]
MVGKRSDKCEICALAKQGGDGLILLDRIDHLLIKGERADKIKEMCQSFNFFTSTSKLATHRRYHLLQEVEEITADFNPENIDTLLPEINVDNTETLVRDLIKECVHSIQRQIALTKITRTMKEESVLSTSINNLLNTISKCSYSFINPSILPEINEEINEYLK